MTGGASVHGYNLAKELALRGHRVLKINGQPDNFTEFHAGLRGFLYTVMLSDIIYVRIDYFIKIRNLIPVIAKLFGKKVVAELNSPSDELLLQGFSKKYMAWMERIWKILIHFPDHVIVVSEPVKSFCVQILNCKSVTVVPNGGEIIDEDELKVGADFKRQFDDIKGKYDKIIIWVGTTNKIQEFDALLKAGMVIDKKYALFVITSGDMEFGDGFKNRDNIFHFSSLERDVIKELLIKSDIGLALFSNYDWCRWGFYISSLKLYEYLCNGLSVITTTKELRDLHPNIFYLDNITGINDVLEKIDKRSITVTDNRTWKQVAGEVEQVMTGVLNHD